MYIAMILAISEAPIVAAAPFGELRYPSGAAPKGQCSLSVGTKPWGTWLVQDYYGDRDAKSGNFASCFATSCSGST